MLLPCFCFLTASRLCRLQPCTRERDRCIHYSRLIPAQLCGAFFCLRHRCLAPPSAYATGIIGSPFFFFFCCLCAGIIAGSMVSEDTVAALVAGTMAGEVTLTRAGSSSGSLRCWQGSLSRAVNRACKHLGLSFIFSHSAKKFKKNCKSVPSSGGPFPFSVFFCSSVFLSRYCRVPPRNSKGPGKGRLRSAERLRFRS